MVEIHINATQRCKFLYITMLITVIVVTITDDAQFILISPLQLPLPQSFPPSPRSRVEQLGGSWQNIGSLVLFQASTHSQIYQQNITCGVDEMCLLGERGRGKGREGERRGGRGRGVCWFCLLFCEVVGNPGVEGAKARCWP